MKTRSKLILFFSSLAMLIAGLCLAPTIAFGLPTSGEVLGPDSQLVSTQPSYVAKSRLRIEDVLTGGGFEIASSPEDMCVDHEDGSIYVADNNSDTKRILKYESPASSSFVQLDSYINESNQTVFFKNPTGVAVNGQHLFVADKLLQKIVVFDKADFSFVKEIARPDSILVGSATRFAPTKVAADDKGNIYAVLEGLTNGVMQLDGEGNFVSYIGANETTKSLLTSLQQFFGVQSEGYLLSSGDPVTNVALDSKGLLYTITNKSAAALKKLNTSGNTIFSTDYNDINTVAAFVDEDGNIFSAQSDGHVTIYDGYGSLLFRFGGRGEEEIMGVLKSPTAISVLPNGELLVLDKEARMLVTYQMTDFAKLVFKAVSYYKDGLYLEGESSWNEVLKYNAKFVLAYKALARASMKKADYNAALKQFKIAGDKAGYSDAFWQIRDSWIRANLGYVVIPLAVLVLAYAVIKAIIARRQTFLAGPRQFVRNIGGAPVVRDLGFTFSFLRHPRDAVYEIKFKKRVSLIGAICLYAVFVALQILRVYLTGYLFNDIGRNDGLQTILMSTLPLLLLVVCNYYVSTVRDGEGKLKDIFISFIYALSPYLLLALPLFLLSNALTYNEQALFYILSGLIYLWCAVNIVLTVMELHDYSFGKAIINILLTLVCFILVIAFVFILYVLGYQLFNYIFSIFKEVAAR